MANWQHRVIDLIDHPKLSVEELCIPFLPVHPCPFLAKIGAGTADHSAALKGVPCWHGS